MLPLWRGCLVSEQQSAEPLDPACMAAGCILSCWQGSLAAICSGSNAAAAAGVAARVCPCAAPSKPAAFTRRCRHRLQRGARHLQAAGAQRNGVPPHSRQLWCGRLEPRGASSPCSATPEPRTAPCSAPLPLGVHVAQLHPGRRLLVVCRAIGRSKVWCWASRC